MKSQRREDYRCAFLSFLREMGNNNMTSTFISDGDIAMSSALKELKERGLWGPVHALDHWHYLRDVSAPKHRLWLYSELLKSRTSSQY